jgi:hypothetical protein
MGLNILSHADEGLDVFDVEWMAIVLTVDYDQNRKVAYVRLMRISI